MRRLLHLLGFRQIEVPDIITSIEVNSDDIGGGHVGFVTSVAYRKRWVWRPKR